MSVKFKHTNIVARNWEALAAFYEDVFECKRVLPERHFSGPWLAKGTGVYEAKLDGIHLRLPGCGEDGPTLEIYKYGVNKRKLLPLPNREGYTHIAFEVDDVSEVITLVIDQGGKMVGEVTTQDIEGVGKLTFVNVADPEGNIIEVHAQA